MKVASWIETGTGGAPGTPFAIVTQTSGPTLVPEQPVLKKIGVPSEPARTLNTAVNSNPLVGGVVVAPAVLTAARCTTPSASCGAHDEPACSKPLMQMTSALKGMMLPVRSALTPVRIVGSLLT